MLGNLLIHEVGDQCVVEVTMLKGKVTQVDDYGTVDDFVQRYDDMTDTYYTKSAEKNRDISFANWVGDVQKKLTSKHILRES